MARTDNNATVPALGVYAQSGAPTFSGDLTGTNEDVAQIFAAEVSDVASLPATGNWTGRRIWVDDIGENRWWNGTGWVRDTADTGWLDIPLGSTFTYQNRPPQVRRIGSVVYVRGDVKPKTGTFTASAVITVSAAGLPTGVRPTGIENRQLAGNSAGVDVRGYVASNGDVVVVTGPAVPVYVDLGGLSGYTVD